MAGEYLDLTLLINGSMDLFLLLLTGHLLGYPLRSTKILAGVLLGEIPVLLNFFFPSSWLSYLSVVFTPLAMVGVSFPIRRLSFWKGLLGLWVGAVGLGGLIYTLIGVWHFEEALGGVGFSLTQDNFWLLPAAALLWWFSQKLWERWQLNRLVLSQTLYEIEIKFEEKGETLLVKALLDTGNQLRDPLTGVPVLLLEEKAALSFLPAQWSGFLQFPWQEMKDPWPLLWRDEGAWLQHFVFIPFQGIDHQSFLLGLHPKRVSWQTETGRQEIAATVALVPQTLDSNGQYQALLHWEHLQKGG